MTENDNLKKELSSQTHVEDDRKDSLPAENTAENLRSWITAFAQGGAIAIAIIYAIGFLIVQSNLSRIGYPAVGEFRIRYFMAGFLWLILSGIPLIIGIILGYCLLHVLFRKLERKPIRPIIKGILIGMALSAMYFFLSIPSFYNRLPFKTLTLESLFVYQLKLFGWGCLFSGFWQDLVKMKQVPLKNKAIYLTAPVVLFLIILMGYYPKYLMIYNSIQSGIGGGLGTPALLRLNNTAMMPEKAIGAPTTQSKATDSESNETLLCLVIDQTSSSYLVEVVSDKDNLLSFASGKKTDIEGSLTEIPRNQILSVVYLPWKDYKQWPLSQERKRATIRSRHTLKLRQQK